MEALLRELFIIALLSTVVIFACSRVKIPPIVGFLITGAALGPSSLGLVKDLHTVDMLAEVGVVFLLFSIGMELSVGELIRLRKPVFLGGTAQVFLTIGAFWLPAYFFWGLPIGPAIFIGFLMALSSTAIVLKILQQKAQMESPAGRISLSILIYQDLIIVPMMLAIPLLAGRTEADMAGLALAAGQTLCIIGVIFLLARKGVPWLLARVVRTKSRELFLISIIGICLGTAWLTAQLGLSLSLGAFLAGLVVAESEYSHSALEGILPFKDVFTSVFFISVGMLLNMSFFLANLPEIAVITLLVLGVKGIIAGGSALLLGYPIRPAIIVGMAVCQVGEFSFVLAKGGLEFDLLSADHYQLFLAASILTMVVTPFLLNAAPAAAALVGRKKNLPPEKEPDNDNALSDHLIILGFGVGGRLLARAARMAGIPYVILEMNPDTVRHYAAEGEPIHHGDAIHPAVLHQLGISRARVLAIVVSDPTAVRAVTEIARHLNPQVHILARTRFLGEVAALKELGASDVIPEEFETSIEIFSRVLSKYLAPVGDITRFTHEVRAENYEMLRTTGVGGASLASLQQHMPDLTITVYTVEKESPLEDTSLLDAGLRQKAGVTVAAVARGDELFAHPGGEFRFAAEDRVYLFSSPVEAAAAAPLFAGVGRDI